jgi:alginate O-acetyltransferase complex protein AlgI
LSFVSPLYLAFVLASAFVTQFARGGLRLALIMIFSAILVATYVPDLLSIVPFALFVAGGYAAIALISVGRMRHATSVSVLVIVILFVWLKRYPFMSAVPALGFPYVLVGLSYILFRMLHVLFDVSQGTMRRPPIARYFAYLFFFPSFLSGPINRYEPFSRDLDAPAGMDRDEAFATLARFLKGFFKVTILGELLLLGQSSLVARLHLALAGGSGSMTLALLYAVTCGSYLVYLYANFSGYTDMAITVGRLFGIVLPENFNRPFTAINLQDFWSRWHITLSEWFKIYFFNPLLLALMRRFPNPRLSPYLGVLGLFVVFLVLGAWHGASWEYMLVGLLLGTGIAANKLWQIEMTRRLGKQAYRALTRQFAYIWASRGLTMAWVAVALTTFWVTIGEAGTLAASMGVIGFIVALAIMSVAYAVCIWLVAGLIDRFGHGEGPAPRPWSAGWRYATLGLAMVGLTFGAALVNSSSTFVYQGF